MLYLYLSNSLKNHFFLFWLKFSLVSGPLWFPWDTAPYNGHAKFKFDKEAFLSLFYMVCLSTVMVHTDHTYSAYICQFAGWLLSGFQLTGTKLSLVVKFLLLFELYKLYIYIYMKNIKINMSFYRAVIYRKRA